MKRYLTFSAEIINVLTYLLTCLLLSLYTTEVQVTAGLTAWLYNMSVGRPPSFDRVSVTRCRSVFRRDIFPARNYFRRVDTCKTDRHTCHCQSVDSSQRLML